MKSKNLNGLSWCQRQRLSEMSLCFATMNHDNLRLNSTHNPENSHIFLGENEQSEVRAQKNSAPRRAQRDDGVTYDM